jgi:hypothetical protein
MKLTNINTPLKRWSFAHRGQSPMRFVDTVAWVPVILNVGGAARYSTVQLESDREN